MFLYLKQLSLSFRGHYFWFGGQVYKFCTGCTITRSLYSRASVQPIIILHSYSIYGNTINTTAFNGNNKIFNFCVMLGFCYSVLPHIVKHDPFRAGGVEFDRFCVQLSVFVTFPATAVHEVVVQNFGANFTISCYLFRRFFTWTIKSVPCIQPLISHFDKNNMSYLKIYFSSFFSFIQKTVHLNI